jgi:hypothetical protein
VVGWGLRDADSEGRLAAGRFARVALHIDDVCAFQAIVITHSRAS